MCQYIKVSVIPNGCQGDPKHVVEYRYYQRCINPQNVGTYRHCDDDHATESNFMQLGSSRTKQETCQTCSHPEQTVVTVSLALYHYKNALANVPQHPGISQLRTPLSPYGRVQLVELARLVARWELFSLGCIWFTSLYTLFSNPVPRCNAFFLANMILCLV